MKIRLLIPILAAAFALAGCVTYDDYGYGAGYYRTQPQVVYRRYGGYPYGYYDGYYGSGYYGGSYYDYGYPYGYRYGYPYYSYPRHHYYRPPYRGHGGSGHHRPPNSGKPPWRDLDRVRQAEGAQPMLPPSRSRNPVSGNAPRTPAYRPAPSANPRVPSYRPAPSVTPRAPASRPAPIVAPRAPAAPRTSVPVGGNGRREEARRARAEMKSGTR